VRILVTNDDGIHAPGLAVLETIARELSDDVWVIAPETDQSGVSHSLSLSDPLRLREISERHFAVKGTPTDCVILGIRHIMKEARPDLVLSGVNRGQNVAEDVTYSGTIAGAMEGTLLGIRSIALSQAYGPKGRDDIKWQCAAHHGPLVIRRVLEIGIEDGILVNVNFPIASRRGAGHRGRDAGPAQPGTLAIHERMDGRGNPYFWIGFARGPITPGTAPTSRPSPNTAFR
jgi:5'-nucleotidase